MLAADLPIETVRADSPIPLYFQLKGLLLEEISSGRWPPGTRFPSEPEIGTHFDVSRTTVRHALDELESEGLIRRERGRGTFVNDRFPEAWFLQSSQGFYDEAVSTGHRVNSRVLRLEVEEPPRWAAEALRLAQGARGVTLERLRWVDDHIVMYVVNHLPPYLAEAVQRADLEAGSLYRALRQEHGLTIARGYRFVQGIAADGRLADLLEIQQGDPLLLVESVSWDADSRPFECYRAWHRADRTKIQVRVVPEDQASKAGVDANIRWLT